MSGIINGNALYITALGIFDYLKNFLVIFIYATFFRDFNEFKKIFRLLLFIAIFLGTVALIQFIWAMGSVYVLGKDITDKSVYIFSTVPIQNMDMDIAWRYGIFRAQSLTYHAYILGLFNLLIFTIYCYTGEKVKIKTVVPLLSGVLSSVSRMAWGGFLFVTLLQLIKHKKWSILLLLVLLCSYAANIISHGNNISPEYSDIRAETRQKALEIWKDHPLTGVGPGMFGGIVAFNYDSYIHEFYNLKLGYVGRVRSIEQFWPQILAEMGAIGTVCFVNVIIILAVTLYKSRERAPSHESANLFSSLIVFIGCILIYSIGSGINIAPVLFTYCAFVGMGLGSLNKLIAIKK